RPVRRVLFRSSRSLDGHLSRRHVAVPLQQPTRGLGGPRQRPLSGLAPGEVYLAGHVTMSPGGLLHHPFTLTAARRRRRSSLCGTVSRISPGGCYPPPCPVEPGRSSVRSPATRPSGRPARPPILTSLGGRSLARVLADMQIQRNVDVEPGEQSRGRRRGRVAHG